MLETCWYLYRASERSEWAGGRRPTCMVPAAVGRRKILLLRHFVTPCDILSHVKFTTTRHFVAWYINTRR